MALLIERNLDDPVSLHVFDRDAAHRDAMNRT